MGRGGKVKGTPHIDEKEITAGFFNDLVSPTDRTNVLVGED